MLEKDVALVDVLEHLFDLLLPLEKLSIVRHLVDLQEDIAMYG
jgi:hypothetical protein